MKPNLVKKPFDMTKVDWSGKRTKEMELMKKKIEGLTYKIQLLRECFLPLPGNNL